MARCALPALALIAFTLTACTANAGGTISVTPSTGSGTSPKASTAPFPVGRKVQFEVLAPASLVAAGGGNIINSDVSGLVAAGGGNLVAAGGGNLVAAGGGNLVAAGGGNLLARTPSFRLQATAADEFKPVEKAVVMFKALTPAGELVDKTAGVTDAMGLISFSGVADRALVAVAVFKVDGKIYELAAPVAKGDQDEATMIDPINTFVAARIRTILLNNKLTNAEVALADLKMVWDHFNDAKVTPDTTALVQGTTLADLNKFYEDNIGKLPQAGQDAVKAYMKKIAAGSK